MSTKPLRSSVPVADTFVNRNLGASTDEELVALARTPPEELARALVRAAEARFGRPMTQGEILAMGRAHTDLGYALEAIALIERAPGAAPADKPS